MPPKRKTTKEMIVDAAYEIVRTQGIEALNARNIAHKLNCSTQPVMYEFKMIEEIKKAVYEKADLYHSTYIMDIHSKNPMKDIGLNYIRFAVNEKNLFRFLFQSNEFSTKSLTDLIDADELSPVLTILSEALQIDVTSGKTIFRSIFLVAHGYASMLANNEMIYDEELVSADLDLVFMGIVSQLKG